MSNFIPVAISILMLWAGIISTNNTEYTQLIEDAKSIASAAHLRNQHYETLLRQVSSSSSLPDSNSQPMPIDSLGSTPSFYQSLKDVLTNKANEYVLLYQTSDDAQKQEALLKLQELKGVLEASLQTQDWNLTEQEVSQNYVELEQVDALLSVSDDEMRQEITDTITYLDQVIAQINTM